MFIEIVFWFLSKQEYNFYEHDSFVTQSSIVLYTTFTFLSPFRTKTFVPSIQSQFSGFKPLCLNLLNFFKKSPCIRK